MNRFQGNPIKAVLFDYDGTLRENIPTTVDRISALCERDSYSLTEELIKKMVRTAHTFWGNRDLVNAFKDANPDEHSFWAGYFNIFLEALDIPDALRETYSRELGNTFILERESSDVPMPGSIDVLEELTSRGLVLGLVSNRAQVYLDSVERHGFTPYFKLVLAAGEVNSWKPAQKIFHYALKNLGDINPHEAVFVGDNYYTDIIGANAVGIHSIMIDIYDTFTDKVDCIRIKSLNEIPEILDF